MRNIGLPFLFFITFLGNAGAIERDGQASLAIAINQDLPKGFDLNFLHELRSKEDNSTLKKSLSDLGLEYKINKNISTEVSYRYTIYPDKFSVRRALSSTLRLETGPIRHFYRMKYQHDEDSDDHPEEFLRHRYSLRFKLNGGLSPFIDMEAFTTRAFGKTELVKHREDIGIKKKLNSNLSLKLFYRLQEEVNVKKPDSLHMLGLKFDIELKN